MVRTPIRTRFAPSPTGYLHVGGARTALFSWLFARHAQGQFILRIEDTDQDRSTSASIDAIIAGLRWLNIDWDEGPYFQSQNLERYQIAITELLDKGYAYRCYCTKERLDALRRSQMQNKQKPRYDQHCRYGASEGLDRSQVIRFCNPESGVVRFTDLIRGEIAVKNEELDDMVLLRSDGTPTFNLSVVIDDWDMGITHVIRGDDHINNTPRQINLLHALGADLPQYAHVPMILGPDGQRLSKRHGAVSVLQYREEGFLPEALLNYLVRLGWSAQDQEIFSQEEMIALFNLASVSRSPSIFNPKKLLWLNQHYLKSVSSELLLPLFAEQLTNKGIQFRDRGPDLRELIPWQVTRYKTLKEMAVHSLYFYEPIILSPDTPGIQQLNQGILPALILVQQRLSYVKDWTKEGIHDLLTEIVKRQDLTMGQLSQALRVAVTGGTASPPIDATIYLIGQKVVVDRLQQAIHYIEK